MNRSLNSVQLALKLVMRVVRRFSITCLTHPQDYYITSALYGAVRCKTSCSHSYLPHQSVTIGLQICEFVSNPVCLTYLLFAPRSSFPLFERRRDGALEAALMECDMEPVYAISWC